MAIYHPWKNVADEVREDLGDGMRTGTFLTDEIQVCSEILALSWPSLPSNTGLRMCFADA